jgi:prophage regulatory protein
MPHWRSFLDVEARGGRYLPWKEVARATGLSRTTAWRLQKRDDFPAPYAISPGRVGYREGEVEAWCVSRGHSTARTGPQTAGAEVGRPAGTMTDRVPPSARPASSGAAAKTEPPAGPAAAPSSPQTASRGRVDPPSARAKPGRRRSEHARAIAQQMLFDF